MTESTADSRTLRSIGLMMAGLGAFAIALMLVAVSVAQVALH